MKRREAALKPGNNVSSAAKVANKDPKSTEEAELELLCSAVEEESFGTAMADCVLIPESLGKTNGVCIYVARSQKSWAPLWSNFGSIW